jgi:hypothetical protein
VQRRGFAFSERGFALAFLSGPDRALDLEKKLKRLDAVMVSLASSFLDLVPLSGPEAPKLRADCPV